MDIRKGDKIRVDLHDIKLDGTVVKVLTRDVVFHCEGLGHPDGCEHRVHQVHVTVTARRPRPNRVDTTPVSIRVRRQMAANARPPRQRPFNLDRWRDDTNLLRVEIDGQVLLDKTTS